MPLQPQGPAPYSTAASIFSCSRYRQPWTDEAQEIVRDYLADALRLDPTIFGIGADEEGNLRAVGVWKVLAYPLSSWKVIVVAVDVRHQRQGLGRQIKEEIRSRAKRSGIKTLLSDVDRRNDAMIALNEQLGGKCRPAGTNDWNLLQCAVPVR